MSSSKAADETALSDSALEEAARKIKQRFVANQDEGLYVSMHKTLEEMGIPEDIRSYWMHQLGPFMSIHQTPAA